MLVRLVIQNIYSAGSPTVPRVHNVQHILGCTLCAVLLYSMMHVWYHSNAMSHSLVPVQLCVIEKLTEKWEWRLHRLRVFVLPIMA